MIFHSIILVPIGIEMMDKALTIKFYRAMNKSKTLPFWGRVFDLGVRARKPNSVFRR